MYIACLMSLWFCGCGENSGPPPVPVYPVSGTITYQGKPVVGASVTFFNAEKSRGAFGKTNKDGMYKLTTFQQNDGCVDGKAIVTVAKFVSAGPQEVQADLESDDYEPPGFSKEPEPKKKDSDIPASYAEQSSTDLVAVVNTTGENVFNFELE